MTGGPSQVDTWDYKPELQKRDGQELAGADPEDRLLHHQRQVPEVAVRVEAARRIGLVGLGSVPAPVAARRRDVLHAFDVLAAEQSRPGVDRTDVRHESPGLAGAGAWMTYGLGSENQDLPAYVVLHDTRPRGDDQIWSAGFLPKTYQAVTLDARRKEAIDNLARDAKHTRRPAARSSSI